MLAKSVAVTSTTREKVKVQSRVIKDQRPGLTVERYFTASGSRSLRDGRVGAAAMR